MRLGLGMGYTGARVQVDVQAVQDAERLGYHSVWTAEAYGSDAVVPLAWLGAMTYRIHLGHRDPPDGRADAGDDRDDGDDAGRPVGRPGAPRPRRLRAAGGRGLARAAVREAARPDAGVRRHRARDPRAPAAARARAASTTRSRIVGPARPGWGSRSGALSTGGPTCPSTWRRSDRRTSPSRRRSQRLAARVLSPGRARDFHDALDQGFARAGVAGKRERFDVAPMAPVVVGEDVEACRARVKPRVALYVGGMGAPKQNFYFDLACRYGYEAEAARIQELYLAGRRPEAEAAVPDALVDEIALCGPPERNRERLTRGGPPASRRWSARRASRRPSAPWPSWSSEEPPRVVRFASTNRTWVSSSPGPPSRCPGDRATECDNVSRKRHVARPPGAKSPVPRLKRAAMPPGVARRTPDRTRGSTQRPCARRTTSRFAGHWDRDSGELQSTRPGGSFRRGSPERRRGAPVTTSPMPRLGDPSVPTVLNPRERPVQPTF